MQQLPAASLLPLDQAGNTDPKAKAATGEASRLVWLSRASTSIALAPEQVPPVGGEGGFEKPHKARKGATGEGAWSRCAWRGSNLLLTALLAWRMVLHL